MKWRMAVFYLLPTLAVPFPLSLTPISGVHPTFVTIKHVRTQQMALNSAGTSSSFRYGRIQPSCPADRQGYTCSNKCCDCCFGPFRGLLMQERNSESGNIRSENGNSTATLAPDLSPVQSALIGLLKGYKALISPIIPPSCRFLPTCSEYSMAAIAQLGPAKG